MTEDCRMCTYFKVNGSAIIQKLIKSHILIPQTRTCIIFFDIVVCPYFQPWFNLIISINYAIHALICIIIPLQFHYCPNKKATYRMNFFASSCKRQIVFLHFRTPKGNICPVSICFAIPICIYHFLREQTASSTM